MEACRVNSAALRHLPVEVLWTRKLQFASTFTLSHVLSQVVIQRRKNLTASEIADYIASMNC